MEHTQIIVEVGKHMGRYFRPQWVEFCGRMEDYAAKLHALAERYGKQAQAVQDSLGGLIELVSLRDQVLEDCRWSRGQEQGERLVEQQKELADLNSRLASSDYAKAVACFPKNYVSIGIDATAFIDIPTKPLFAKPPDLINPAVWFFGPLRILDEVSQALSDAVFLGVAHLAYVSKWGSTPVVYVPGSYPKGGRFHADAFVRELNRDVEDAGLVGSAWEQIKGKLRQDEKPDSKAPGDGQTKVPQKAGRKSLASKKEGTQRQRGGE
jgi:hypothetical protein